MRQGRSLYWKSLTSCIRVRKAGTQTIAASPHPTLIATFAEGTCLDRGDPQPAARAILSNGPMTTGSSAPDGANVPTATATAVTAVRSVCSPPCDSTTTQWLETWLNPTSRTWIPVTVTFHFNGRESPAPHPGVSSMGLGGLTKSVTSQSEGEPKSSLFLGMVAAFCLFQCMII